MPSEPRRPLPPNLIVSVQDVVRRLKDAKRQGLGCCLLIGAGCSVSAGIPASAGCVERLKCLHPEDYAEACRTNDPPGYAEAMAPLSDHERKTFITHYVKRAQVNWAHIAIASLIKGGYVDRVLTTKPDRELDTHVAKSDDCNFHKLDLNQS